MNSNFSFSALLQHLEAGTSAWPAIFPDQNHMDMVMRAYIENINNPDPEFYSKYVAENLTGEDPVGSMSSDSDNYVPDFAQSLKQLIDVPFTPKKAEIIAPIRFSLKNEAAMAFKFWAEIDGRNISIDIIDVMTFDETGKICNIKAYWGVDNVTLLD
ncbi:hypothetical protein SAV10_003727 [Salmonella enterica]|nr:hypothetical protein [Salmonella enterica]